MAFIGETCKRCKKEPTTLLSRKDTFCDGCFIRFIRGKQRKQMQNEKFKVKFNEKVVKPRVLLDMKNSNESYVLLDILISMLEEQLSQGPKALRGFDLIVCIINDSKTKEYQVELETIKQYYTNEELERLGLKFVNINVDSFVTNNTLEHLELNLKNFQTSRILNKQGLKIENYDDLLSQISDKSTREDIINIIHEDIIIQTAKDEDCSIVLKSHSMTKMAIDILSNTIRGRGPEIPIQSSDSYIGTFEIMHPLRDVLNSEIKMYANIKKLNELSPILDITSTISDKSTKNKTVDEMVTEYFDTLEVEYPETVSTVVKIGAKLANPKDIKHESISKCEICKVPIYHDPKEWLEKITVLDCVGPQNEEEEANLRRYLDSIIDFTEETSETIGQSKDENVNLCYGCMITLGVSEVKDFQWPQRPTREEILAEYILEDDDDE
jgi:cytoplasmic tRNA 2-thiolation protein 2